MRCINLTFRIANNLDAKLAVKTPFAVTESVFLALATAHFVVFSVVPAPLLVQASFPSL